MTFSRTIRRGAYFDLIWAIPMAIPIVSRNFLEALAWFHNVFAIEGIFPFFSSTHLVAVNLLGAQTITWTWVRLVRKEHEFGYIDMTLRLLRAGIGLYYYMFENITGLALFGILIEFYWCVIYYRAFLIERQNAKQGVSEGSIPDKYEQIGT